MNRLLPILLFFASFSQAENFDCSDLGNLVDSGGREEKTSKWKLGKAPGFSRTFRISWQMYSIPDSVKISYIGKDSQKVDYVTGFISGTGTYDIELSSSKTQTVNVTVNSGGGNSGTAWEYSIEEVGSDVIDLTLSGQSHADVWRNAFTTQGLSATKPIEFDPESTYDGGRSRYYFTNVYKFVAPSNSRAIRIRSPKNVYISVKRSCIPLPGEKIKNRSSHNRISRNTITFDEITGLPEAGATYYITAAQPILHSQLQGGASSGISSPGDLEVDSYGSGTWGQAKGKILGVTGKVLVGIENENGYSIPYPRERIVLLNHGRTDSPFGNMNGVGRAAESRWGTEAYYVNWSDGSFANPLGLDGSKYIKPSGRVIAKLLKKGGYKKTGDIDFSGHSWGTYVGYEIAKGMKGKYKRAYFLDPASSAPGYRGVISVPKTKFRKIATYSMGMYGTGPGDSTYGVYGHPQNAGEAHDSIGLQSDTSSLSPIWNRWGAYHQLPVKAFETMLLGGQPWWFDANVSWAYSLSDDDAKWLKYYYPWKRNVFNAYSLTPGVKGKLDVRASQVDYQTGTISAMDYLDWYDPKISVSFP